jgi:hypothetical protein
MTKYKVGGLSKDFNDLVDEDNPVVTLFVVVVVAGFVVLVGTAAVEEDEDDEEEEEEDDGAVLVVAAVELPAAGGAEPDGSTPVTEVEAVSTAPGNPPDDFTRTLFASKCKAITSFNLSISFC